MRKLILLVALIGAAGLVRADDAVLKAISGPVTVGATAAPAKEGQAVKAKETVHVGPGAVAHLVFSNGDTVLVKENSDFSYDNDKNGTLVSFERGEYLIGTSAKRKSGETFRVKTPAAVASAKGASVFWGKSDEAKTSSYASFAGSLDLLAAEHRVTLQANQTLQVTYDKAPGIPTVSKIDPIYVETFAINGSLQGVDGMMKRGKK